MEKIYLEHINITVSDSVKSAELVCRLFDWRIRWQGPSLNRGYTVHVGGDDRYIAFYTPKPPLKEKPIAYKSCATLAHIGVVVIDLNAAEKRVLLEGLTTYNHQQYEPGKRFYFLDWDGVEYEVLSYDQN